MMHFANSLWLWGLLGLSIPIGIHLLSRKEGKVIWMGSIRYLQESPTTQFKTIRLNEILLLILRCILLTLIVLFLAGASLNFVAEENRKWFLIENGIEKTSEYDRWIEKLNPQGFEVRYLAPGFPLVSDSSSLKPISSYWILVENIVKENIDSVVVLSYNYDKYFKGKQISEPDFLWFTVKPEDHEAIVSSVHNGDSVKIKRGHFTSTFTAFSDATVSASELNDPISSPDTFRIDIVSDNVHEYDRKIITAALEAIKTITPHQFKIEQHTSEKYKPRETDYIFWLSNDVPPKTSDHSLTFGIANCEYETVPLFLSASEATEHCKTNNQLDFIITSRLNEEIALEKNLTIELAKLLIHIQADKLSSNDRRVMAEAGMWKGSGNTTSTRSAGRLYDLGTIITVLFFLVLMSERWISFKRNQ